MFRKKQKLTPQVIILDESSPKPQKWHKVHQLLHDNKGIRYFVMAIGLILATGVFLIGVLLSYQEPQLVDSGNIKVAKKPPAKIYSPLSGAEISDASLANRPVTAIVIENSPEARPQSGLKQAGIVYEAIAEGGITRCLALYQENRPQLIGPVRSVRPYYVEWAAQYDPSIVHVGGSSRALSMVRGGGYGVDLDQFFNGGSFWRVADRRAPHNVYTSFDKIDTLANSKGKTTSQFVPYLRHDIKKIDAPQASNINIDVSSGQFHVEYSYDPGSNSYKRTQGGQPHIDREEGQIAPQTVIAMKVPVSIAMEDGYREQINTSGTGSAFIFQNGTVIEATWSRGGDPKSNLVFKDLSGRDISLNRGQTWITALSDQRGVSWQ